MKHHNLWTNAVDWFNQMKPKLFLIIYPQNKYTYINIEFCKENKKYFNTQKYAKQNKIEQM